MIVELELSLTQKSFYQAEANLLDSIREAQHFMRVVIHWAFPESTDPYFLQSNSQSKLNNEPDFFHPNQFYELLKPSGNEPLLESPPAQLNVLLRNYQSRAVRWMLDRENIEPTNSLHPLWSKLTCGNSEFYYNQVRF